VPTWKSTAGGNWTDPLNWRVAVPNGAGATANLSHAIDAPRSVTLDTSVTLANLYFNSPQKYTIVGDATHTLSVSTDIGVYGGAHEIAAPLLPTANPSLSVSGTSSALKLVGGVVGRLGSVAVTSGGRLDIDAGKLVVASAPTPIGSWDGAAYTGITGMIASGRNGGGWGGSGIVTSQSNAATGNFTSIGVATAQQVKNLATASDTAVWSGQTVTGSDSLVMYTYGGDANLDGKITVDDYGRIDFNVGLGTAGWFNGDFNYDGKITVDDYGIIDFNVGIQGAPFPTGSSVAGLFVTTVPEPSTIGVVALVVASLFGARKRRALQRA
jgi:hypothetical protein